MIGVGGLPTNKIIEKRWDAFVPDEAVNHRQSKLTSGTGKKGEVCRVPDLIVPEPQTQLFSERGRGQRLTQNSRESELDRRAGGCPGSLTCEPPRGAH